MSSARSWVALAAAGLAASAVPAALAAPASGAGAAHHPAHPAVSAPHHRPSSHGSVSRTAKTRQPRGHVAPKSTVRFQVTMSLRHAHQARQFVREVSTPGSATYHHFLSDAQWQKRFGPTSRQIGSTRHWLRTHGFKVGATPKSRLFVSARGSARHVEKVFSTHLAYYRVNGHKVRLAKNSISVPHAIASAVSGTVGINQYVATPKLSMTPHSRAAVRPSDSEPPPPAGFRNAPLCTSAFGDKYDHADNPALYAPYKPHRPYDICGYHPSQLRSAYGINNSVNAGHDGSGVAIAIVDAYDSPTLFKDAHHYTKLNDPSHPLKSSQFTDVNPGSVANADVCGGSGWYAEQALDVESSHSMAPGAHIVYVGATDCFDNNLLSALNTAVTSGASVVSNSWGDTMGDLLEDPASKDAFDNTFLLADATGVSVLFSSGDDGDNFADFGLNVPDYPATSPFITTVGGTTLKVNSSGTREGEFGWSTAKQTMCAGVPQPNCGDATEPAGSLAFQSGGGGGTSYYYTQPYYQAGVVPDSLALRNQAIFGPVPLRVEPDISMDADAQSGMLIGLTQTFPDGTYYDQFKEGGTSLASPLLAGVVADTDQAAGRPLGFLNPDIYKVAGNANAIHDIVPPKDPLAEGIIRVDFANTVDASDGYTVSLRTIDYEGPETYCDGTGNCATRPVTLTTDKGFDSMTGLGVIGAKFVKVLSRF